MTTDSVTITVRFFAMLRELIGEAATSLDVPAGTSAESLFDLIAANYPHIAPMKRSILIMINEEYAAPGQLLEHGDDVALIPPVSGGAHLFTCTEAHLDPRQVEALVAGPDAGAIVTFVGTVRNVARGRDVVALDYEAYPSAAGKMLARVGAEVEEQWPDVRIAISHRYGHLVPGEASVVIACASPHRDAAYAASAFAIARIKEIVPIWKKEHYADGSAWIGSEHEYQIETGRL